MSQQLASYEGMTTAWRPSSSPAIIGKDLLELLSSSMYVDPMTIYREYVQNSADAIDEARGAGLLAPAKQGKVEISIDADGRTIRIRDNGIGIQQEQFEEVLTAFGASSKRGTEARGFRGVGRLAGLGYCQELIFRTRASGDSKVSEMRWDCRDIKSMLRTAESNSSLLEIVGKAVSVRRVNGKGCPDHFFEVELQGIVRHKNDSLLNEVVVYDYLSEVAPVPFSPDFKFGEEIISALSAHGSMGDLEIRLEGLDSPVYRPHRNELQARGGVHDRFTEVEIHQIPSIDGEVGALAWMLHHGYKGAIAVTQIRGLRLRSGNIQVGGHDLLEGLFQESRFNSWSVGEIHTFDRRIVPNGRRDHYEQNVHFNNLTNHLTPIARHLSVRCRQSSILRNLLGEFSRRESHLKDLLQAISQGCLTTEDRKKKLAEMDVLLDQMRRLSSRNILQPDVQNSLRDVIAAAEKEVVREKRAGRTDNQAHSRLPVKGRQAYRRLIALIYECSSSPASAHALVERILDKLNA